MTYPDPSHIMSLKRVAFQRLKVISRQMLSREMAFLADTATFDVIVDDITQHIVFEMRAQVLAEQLPPQEIRHRIRVETSDPRHATWWDFFKDTYRNRWWMGWRSWPVRYVDKPVWLDRTVAVSVRDHWTHPRAAVSVPPNFGSPVLMTMWDAMDSPIDWRRSR